MSEAALYGTGAAALTRGLRRLPEEVEARRRIAGWYRTALANLGVEVPGDRGDRTHAYHQFVVRVPGRDWVRASSSTCSWRSSSGSSRTANNSRREALVSAGASRFLQALALPLGDRAVEPQFPPKKHETHQPFLPAVGFSRP